MRVGAGVTSGRGLSEFLHPFLGCIPCWGNLDLKIHACACPERVALGVGVRRERPFLGLQAFPAEAWSTRAAVNQSFSEAPPGEERKSQRARFRHSNLLLPALAAVTRSILANLARAVLVRARGVKRASR